MSNKKTLIKVAFVTASSLVLTGFQPGGPHPFPQPSPAQKEAALKKEAALREAEAARIEKITENDKYGTYDVDPRTGLCLLNSAIYSPNLQPIHAPAPCTKEVLEQAPTEHRKFAKVIVETKPAPQPALREAEAARIEKITENDKYGTYDVDPRTGLCLVNSAIYSPNLVLIHAPAPCTKEVLMQVPTEHRKFARVIVETKPAPQP